MAEVLQFYSLTWVEILDLEVTWFCKLYNRMPVVQARRMKDWLPIFAYPHLNKDGHRDVVKALDVQGRIRAGSLIVTPTPKEVAEAKHGWSRLRQVNSEIIGGGFR